MKKIIYVFAACIFSLPVSAQLIVQSGATLYLSGNALVVLQDVNLVNDGSITVAANGKAAECLSGLILVLIESI